MTKHRYFQFMTIALCLSGFSGCATQPIAPEYRQAAQAEDLTFSAVLQDPDAYVGDVVLWGGAILDTRNTRNGTDITVLQIPLDKGERPEGARYSKGRFIVRSSRFLDPEIFRRKKRITMAGVVAGKETGSLGSASYTYPVVTLKQIYLWQRRPRYVYPYDYWWGPPYWGPYWDWGPYYWGPYWDDGAGFDDFDHEDEDLYRGERGGEAHEDRTGEARERGGSERH